MEDSHEELHGAPLFGRWVVTTAIAHAVGALAWALPAGWLVRGPGEMAGPASTVVMLGLTIVAALVQGAVLGAAQGTVLRAVVPVRLVRWIGATAFGVALGWSMIVASAPTLGGADRALASIPLSLTLVGLGFGLAVGFCQWVVLRDHVDGIGWILANAVGWAIALLIVVGAVASAGAGGAVALAIGATAAVISGGVIGLVTGAVLVRIAR